MAISWRAAEVRDPWALVINESLATELGLDPDWLRSAEGIRLLVGNLVPAEATPVAQAYAGHQFGGYSPRLGDGRALLLGELNAADGDLRDLHLKGSGQTPFARGGDGLAAVGPMLREYLVSEAMHALAIPTTRSLAVVATGRSVHRETVLPGAVLARVASSHLRVGSFQYAAGTGNADLLRRLADHAITRHYPDAAATGRPYLTLLEAVISTQASLVAHWMLVGFVHGVMNTDNMTISGETIDYGPCAFMDAFDSATVYSSIDTQGRYAYGNQPLVAQWNLARLAETLLPLIDPDQERAVALAVEALHGFTEQYQHVYADGMRTKLGLPADLDQATIMALTNDLLGLLQHYAVDYTSFLRSLSTAAAPDNDRIHQLLPEAAATSAWLQQWRRFAPDAIQMDQVNPVYVPRNHLVEDALTAAAGGDLQPYEQLLSAVTNPFREQPDLSGYADPAPRDFGVYRTFCGT
ncbi:MAG: YdiU family protein [Microlunatus sp.]|nr:YdiU family protein [Microlunatus sp.]